MIDVKYNLQLVNKHNVIKMLYNIIITPATVKNDCRGEHTSTKTQHTWKKNMKKDMTIIT